MIADVNITHVYADAKEHIILLYIGIMKTFLFEFFKFRASHSWLVKLSTSKLICCLGYLVSRNSSWNGEYDSAMESSFRIMPQDYKRLTVVQHK